MATEFIQVVEDGVRAIKCSAWRWMLGMTSIYKATYIKDKIWIVNGNKIECDIQLYTAKNPDVPDLRNPATTGCLQALVRKAWNDPYIHTRWSISESRWEVIRSPVPGLTSHGLEHGRVAGTGLTEGQALAAALEAAPQQAESI